VIRRARTRASLDGLSVAYHFLRDAIWPKRLRRTCSSACIGIWRGASPAHAGFWLRKVAVQRSIDAGRRRMRRPQVSLEDVREPSIRPNPAIPMLGELLRKLIATLPESPRMVMVLRYQEDLDPGRSLK